MVSSALTPKPRDAASQLARLERLGVPEPFRAGIVARPRPAYHTLLPLAVVLGAIAAATAGLVLWSWQLRAIAAGQAMAAGALLYDSDFGPGELAALFAVLLLAGWLLTTLIGKFGVEAARNRWAHDVMQEPVRYKSAVDTMWRFMITRHGRGARDAEAFLDQLAAGLAKDLGWAVLVLVALAGALAVALPANVSFATRSTVSERPILAVFAGATTHAISSATGLTTGCADISKQGPTLSYKIEFPDGATADLGGWTPLASQPGAQIAALEAVAAALPAGIAVKRWRDIVGRAQLQASCLQAMAEGAGAAGVPRLIRLLGATTQERAVLGAGL